MLVVAPLGRDGPAMIAMLQGRGIAAVSCRTLVEAAEQISDDTAAIILTEEALQFPHFGRLLEALKTQPSWSQLPILVISSGGENRLTTLLELTNAISGTVTMLERPMHAATFLSAVQVALRSRERQYQLRELLEDQERSARARERHARELERILAERTIELMETHETVRRNEAMAVLGTLAGGISHDLGNLLLPLRTHLHLLQSGELTPALKEHVAAMSRSVEYLGDLARRLRRQLASTPRDSAEYQPIDLAEWCRESTPFYRGILPFAVDFTYELGDDLPPLAVNRTALTQAVYNLVQNAGKAIAKGGGAGTVVLRVSREQQALKIEVEDDGPGMSPEVLSHCMERSFTTDAHAGSLGLGLSLVRAFTDSAGARVEVQSPPADKSRGTAFIMRFPAAAAPSPARETAPINVTGR